MFLILLLLAAISVEASWFPPLHDSTCGFTRDQAYKCIRKYADVKEGEGIRKINVENAISKYAPGYIRVWTFFTGADRIMNDCDYDKNGIITARDWKLSESSCLPSKSSLCTFKWFCDRAETV